MYAVHRWKRNKNLRLDHAVSLASQLSHDVKQVQLQHQHLSLQQTKQMQPDKITAQWCLELVKHIIRLNSATMASSNLNICISNKHKECTQIKPQKHIAS